MQERREMLNPNRREAAHKYCEEYTKTIRMKQCVRRERRNSKKDHVSVYPHVKILTRKDVPPRVRRQGTVDGLDVIAFEIQVPALHNTDHERGQSDEEDKH